MLIKFTIQNVPIKLKFGIGSKLFLKNLQYKMFLLNMTILVWNEKIKVFTIQNVPIKFITILYKIQF